MASACGSTIAADIGGVCSRFPAHGERIREAADLRYPWTCSGAHGTDLVAAGGPELSAGRFVPWCGGARRTIMRSSALTCAGTSGRRWRRSWCMADAWEGIAQQWSSSLRGTRTHTRSTPCHCPGPAFRECQSRCGALCLRRPPPHWIRDGSHTHGVAADLISPETRFPPRKNSCTSPRKNNFPFSLFRISSLA